MVIIVAFYLKEHKLDYTEIQSIIGYKFQNQELLAIALQHASVNTSLYNYERLEFLGDSILNAIVSEWLYNNNPDKDEGYLTKQKSLIVNKKKISTISNEMNLIKYANISSSINLDSISTKQRISSDLYESIVGAIFLDSNYENTKIFIKKSLLNQIDFLIENINSKGNLSEFCYMKKFKQPIYRLVKESGPDHEKFYKVSLLVNDENFVGSGFRIKEAENMAAFNALEYFDFFS